MIARIVRVFLRIDLERDLSMSACSDKEDYQRQDRLLFNYTSHDL